MHPSAIFISISDLLRLEMSLGLLSGYGSGSESEEEEVPTGGRSEDTNSVHDRLRLLTASSLALPPPPPPPPEPELLPNPLAHKATILGGKSPTLPDHQLEYLLNYSMTHTLQIWGNKFPWQVRDRGLFAALS